VTVKLMSWNMQGAGLGNKPSGKWEALGNWLVDTEDEDRPEVIALQETGPLPDRLPWYWKYEDKLDGNGWDVLVYSWQANNTEGDEYIDYFVSYVFLDVGGHRVNLAVVTQTQPEDAATTFAELRPALGVLTDDLWLFSVHASAAHGWDAAEIMANIFTTVRCGPWIALGDWNRQPHEVAWRGEDLAQLTRQCGLHCVAPNNPTQPRVVTPGKYPRVIDYCVHTNGTGVSWAGRLDMDCSDHYAVVFS
jgi:hypothetical protein